LAVRRPSQNNFLDSMPDQPLISVIIPTYNCAAYVGQAIASVVAQTYDRHEIIVVDDGSTDETKNVLGPYWEQIRYVYQDNRGLAGARNTGIREAQGDLIAFLDADDIWFSNKLALQVHAFKRHRKAGVVFADFMDFDDARVTRSSRLTTWPQAMAWFNRHRVGASEMAFGPMYEELLKANWIHASSAIVRRDALSKVGWFDETLRAGEDLELWLRVARRYPFLCVNRVLSGYRYRADSLCGPIDSRATRVNQIVVKVLEQHLRRHEIPQEHVSSVRRVLCQRYWSLGWTYFGENRFAEARGYFRQGLRYQPFHREHWLYLCASFLPVAMIEAVRRVRRWGRSLHAHPETAAQ